MKFLEGRETKNFKNFKKPSLAERSLKNSSFRREKMSKRRLFYVSFGKRSPIEVFEVVEVFLGLKHIGETLCFVKTSRENVYVFYPRKNFRNFKNFKQAYFQKRSLKNASFGVEIAHRKRLKKASFRKRSPVEVFEVVGFSSNKKLHRR
ncbi:MAG: hypothetical protein ACTSXC_07595 [Candidatus Freyarchaeota archaeon]